jgi:hypothetical protein
VQADLVRQAIDYRIVITPANRSEKVYEMGDTLHFELSGKHDTRLRAVASLPMTQEEVSKILLEPFFEF